MSQRPRRRRRLRSPSPSPSPPQPRARQPRKAGAAARGVKPSFALLSARCRRAVASDFGTTVLFGWVAECLTTCFVPAAVTSTGVDVSSVLLNVVGAVLGGVALGIQESESGGRFSLQMRRMATLFRGGFVGVFTVSARCSHCQQTQHLRPCLSMSMRSHSPHLANRAPAQSWSWIMEHALHIATAKGGDQTSVLPQLPRAAHGALFVLGSISSGLVAARAGFAVGASCARVDTKRRKRSSTKLVADPAYGVLCALALFTAACVMRASLSMTGSEAFPSGFAASSDKIAPSSLHRDAHELLVGLMFATLALAVGDHVGGFPDYVSHGM
eukprot:COSAG01_NODE_3595_length_5895_cov_74.356046_5_plen_328_part_00